MSAHPHVFIDAVVRFDFENGLVHSVTVEWRFDELMSNALIEDHDRNGDGRFDPEEAARQSRDVLKPLKSESYFAHVRVDEALQAAPDIQTFEAEIDGTRVVYRFAVPFADPVDPRTQAIGVSLYDPTYYIDIALDEFDPVRFSGGGHGGCHYRVVEDTGNPIYYGLVNPWRVDLICPNGATAS